MVKPPFVQERLKMARRGPCKTPKEWEELIEEWGEKQLTESRFL